MSVDTAGDVAVVVVNYGSAQLIAANIATDLGVGPVVVVDNLHSAGERATVQSMCAERGWHAVPMPDNRGFGVAVNAGARRARELGCSAVLLVNPDARIGAAEAQAIAAHLRAEPDTIVSPRIVDSTGRPVFRGVELMLDDGTMRRAGLDLDARAAARPAQLWLTGACLGVPLAVFDRIGGFAEDYFLYWEDVDFSVRAVAAGARLQVRQDLEVVHDEGGTQGERRGTAKSAIYYRYNCRNRLLFAAHNLPTRGQLRWLLRTPKASIEILLRGGRRQLVQSARPLLATLRGTLEGLGSAGPGLGAARDGPPRLSGATGR